MAVCELRSGLPSIKSMGVFIARGRNIQGFKSRSGRVMQSSVVSAGSKWPLALVDAC